MPPGELVDLGTGDTSFVVDAAAAGGAVLHWGAALGDLDAVGLAATGAALSLPASVGGLDAVAPVSFVPEHGSGYPARPGLSGRRRDGTAWSPRVAPAVMEQTQDGAVLQTIDTGAGLLLATEVRRHPGGAIAVTTSVRNNGDDDYLLDDLTVTLALPAHATELMTFHGRWSRELHSQRRPFTTGSVTAENRRGRTSHETPPLLFAGTDGFGEHVGEVWGAHLAWSGNSRITAERLPDGRAAIQLGELLHPGEVVLAAGDQYTTPVVYAVHSTEGLTAATRQFHAIVRSSRAQRARPRPVVLNTWEAVHFDHHFDTLTGLADRAAAVGVERFVLDDGWFGGRRDDTAGLGDWWVSPDAHPGGLTPLIDHVRALGMEFGIWVEPEMVNPDSDLFRAHPDWALVTPGYEPVLGRHQIVLDLARADAFDEVLGRLDALLRDHAISFVKWDMNRDHVQASGADGRAGTHAQTLALYRLLDELGLRHPDVEFESCSSGGARIDLAILERAGRVWTSDCIDALERQTIQRHASMLIPPEVMGSHVGPTTALTTGRTHSLAFRAATALFGHFGIEWNLLGLDEHELTELAAWVGVYKQHRDLLHGGDVVRIDHDDPHALVHGVLAPDRSRAIIAYVQLTTALALAPRPVRIPELDPDRRYHVTLLPVPGRPHGPRLTKGSVAVADGIVLTGRQLASHGVRLPVVSPESIELLWIEALP